jgi:glyoxylase-like metal-dependent hydrolase (beta-lactamase superfamily II)
VYTFIEDKFWLDRMDVQGVDRQLVEIPTKEIVPGVTMIRCGGHFDGSAVLHWKERGVLCIADTILTVPVFMLLWIG